MSNGSPPMNCDYSHFETEARIWVQNNPKSFEGLEVPSDRRSSNHRSATRYREINIDFRCFRP